MLDMKEEFYNINYLKEQAKNTEESTKALFKRLKKKKPKDLDKIVHDLHFEVFDEVDCLKCANCCRGLGPRVTDKDVERLSKAERMKPAKFVETYLQVDEDNDYVFKTMPCPFLMSDNCCIVYESRTKACREYPHTDRKKFFQLLNLTLKNIPVCPAVFHIVERLKEHYKNR